jgi:HK97 gp10 family phage protein
VARVRLDQAALSRTIRDASRRELEAASRQAVNRAKILAPVDTGRLRASIRVEARRTLTLRSVYTIGSDVFYAPFVNDGTRPHRIYPRRGRFLRFTVGGDVVYARVVRHPGTRARPFLDQALRETALARGYRFRTT